MWNLKIIYISRVPLLQVNTDHNAIVLSYFLSIKTCERDSWEKVILRIPAVFSDNKKCDSLYSS